MKGRILLLFRLVFRPCRVYYCICVRADIARRDARSVALPIKVHHFGVLVVWDLLQQLDIFGVTQAVHELVSVGLALRVPVPADLRQIRWLAHM